MPELSLTTFVDIVSASGTTKLSKVRQAKLRPKYSPAIDFYRNFREHICNIHKRNESKSELQKILKGLTDKKKITNYPSLVKGYSKWWGAKKLNWFDPSASVWSAHKVDVRVNPELGLNINGYNHLIKLYMKTEGISKNKIDIILHLMHISLCDPKKQNIMSVLDVRNNHLISYTTPINGLSAALDGELAYISAVWDNI